MRFSKREQLFLRCLKRSAVSDFFIATFSKNPMFAPFRVHNPPGDVHKYAEHTGGEVMNSSKQEVSTKLAQLIDDIARAIRLATFFRYTAEGRVL